MDDKPIGGISSLCLRVDNSEQNGDGNRNRLPNDLTDQKYLRQNMKSIMQSEYSAVKKIQIAMAAVSFSLYRVAYKVMNSL